MEKVDYNKKIRTCEKLGAKKFQKLLLLFDRKKWNFIKKTISNYISIADKLLESEKNKKIKKAKTEEEKDNVKREFAFAKMDLRKEYNIGGNLNYHIDKQRVTDFIEKANRNKRIHQKGLINNAFLFPVGIGISMFLFWPGVLLASYQVFAAFKNFQCVNVQNYNIYRIKRIEEKLIKKEEKELEEKIEKYKDGYQVIGDKIEEKKDIVNIDEIVNSITSIDQLKQIRELLTKEQAKRNINKVDVTIKKGGK